jgi:hypothetical protein
MPHVRNLGHGMSSMVEVVNCNGNLFARKTFRLPPGDMTE